MEDENSILPPPKRTPWNKGKLIGAKPPLLARHVWSIRTKLQIERRSGAPPAAKITHGRCHGTGSGSGRATAAKEADSRLRCTSKVSFGS